MVCSDPKINDSFVQISAIDLEKLRTTINNTSLSDVKYIAKGRYIKSEIYVLVCTYDNDKMELKKYLKDTKDWKLLVELH